MTNREKFIAEIEELIQTNAEALSAEAQAYFNELKGGRASLGGITDVGAKILVWLQENRGVQEYYSARLIGEGLFIPAKSVSGATRKLISDGYLVKDGKNPVTYALTQKGLSFTMDESVTI